MSLTIQYEPWNIVHNGTILEDYVSKKNNLETIAQILEQGNALSYIETINILSLNMETLTVDEMFAFMENTVNPLLKRNIVEKDQQLIRLVLFVHYLLGDPKGVVSQEMYENLLERVQSEFKSYPLTYWSDTELSLLFRFQISEADILDTIVTIFIGNVKDDWETRLNLILEHPECIKRSRSFYNLIACIIQKDIDWTVIKIPLLQALLGPDTFTFEECGLVLSRCQDPAIQKVVVEKLLACDTLDSRRYIFLMTHLLPQLKDHFEGFLVQLSQLPVFCDVAASGSFELSECIFESSMDSFVDFFKKVDGPTRLIAYHNFMKCFLFHWQSGIKPFSFEEEALLDQLQKLRINDSFGYLEFLEKIKILNCARTIKNFDVHEHFLAPRLGRIGQAFCIDNSWSHAVIFFLEKHPDSVPGTLSLMLDELCGADSDRRFELLTSLKCELRHVFYTKNYSRPFLDTYYEVLMRYARDRRVAGDEELSIKSQQDLASAFESGQLTFFQAISVLEFLKSQKICLEEKEKQLLVKIFFDREREFSDGEFYRNFVCILKVFAEFTHEESMNLPKIENFAQYFTHANQIIRSQKEKNLKSAAELISNVIRNRFDAILMIASFLEVDKMHLMMIYRRVIKQLQVLVKKDVISLKNAKLKKHSQPDHNGWREKKHKEAQECLQKCFGKQPKEIQEYFAAKKISEEKKAFLKISFGEALKANKTSEAPKHSNLIEHKLKSFSKKNLESLYNLLDTFEADLAKLEKEPSD